MPQETKKRLLAWLLGLLVSASVTGLVATISVPRIPANDPANCRAMRKTAASASIMQMGLM